LGAKTIFSASNSEEAMAQLLYFMRQSNQSSKNFIKSLNSDPLHLKHSKTTI